MTRIGAPYSPVAFKTVTETPILWFAWFKCDACGYSSVASTARAPWPALEDATKYQDSSLEASRGDKKKAIQQVVAHYFDDEDSQVTWHPALSLGREFKEVPQHIADAASEAYACFSIRSYRAAILMARSVLEASAKDKNVTNGTLASKIDALADNGVISPQIQQEAHEIRYLGNEMAHGDFTEPVSEEDADDMLGFLATFLNYVYQMPAAIRRRQEARRKRAANPNI